MEITEIAIDRLIEASWNANTMEQKMLARLRESIRRYGILENLVVRPIDTNKLKVLSGNHRLKVLKEMGFTHVSCVVVNLDEARSRLLAQALNRIRGQDDLGLRAELLRKSLEDLPQSEVIDLLPETAITLKALTIMDEETIASYLKNWQQAQSVKLKHLQFQLTTSQLETVEEALMSMLRLAKEMPMGSPNVRGTALYLLCKAHLDKEK